MKLTTMFKNFSSLPWTHIINRDLLDNSDVVFIIGVICNKKFMPFYIGGTNRFLKNNRDDRMNDFVSAQFKAPNDFKVGEVIKYFIEKEYKIKVQYKIVDSWRIRKPKIHNEIIKNINYRLLNDYILHNKRKSYDYRKDDEEEVRKMG